jgi:hypothetical protein
VAVGTDCTGSYKTTIRSRPTLKVLVANKTGIFIPQSIQDTATDVEANFFVNVQIIEKISNST